MLGLVAGAVVGAAVSFAYVPTAVADGVTCEAECPEGTAITKFDETIHRVIADGGFLWVEDRCEAFCSPIVPCHWPNVPVVTAESGFTCEPLTGFSTLPPDPDVDLSWGAAWSEDTGGDGLGGQLEVVGSGFEAFEGQKAYVALLRGDQSEVYAVLGETVASGGFTMDFRELVPPETMTLAYFVDANGDASCEMDPVYITVVVNVPASAPAMVFDLPFDDPGHSSNQSLCPLIEAEL